MKLSKEEELEIKQTFATLKGNNRRKEDEHTLFSEHHYVCPICKKDFSTYFTTGWAYKRRHNTTMFTFCGYVCTTKYDMVFDKHKKIRH